MNKRGKELQGIVTLLWLWKIPLLRKSFFKALVGCRIGSFCYAVFSSVFRLFTTTTTTTIEFRDQANSKEQVVV
jgi:hypothetical protein